MEFTTIDGLKVRYRLHRNAGAPKLLVTNSLPQSIRCWDHHWDALATSYEILAFDLPGFGFSESRDEHLAPSGQAAFLAKAIEQFSWQNCIAVGPDIGAPVVLALAQASPHLVAGLVIFDGPGYYPPVFSNDLKWSMESAIFRKIAVWTYNPQVYLKAVFARGYRKVSPTPDEYAEYLEVNRSRESLRRTVTFLGSYPVELKVIGDNLATMQVPTLIVWGEEDVFVPVDNAKELARRIPNNTLHIFKGCGHFSHEDAGQEFTDVLNSWTATLKPAAAGAV